MKRSQDLVQQREFPRSPSTRAIVTLASLLSIAAGCSGNVGDNNGDWDLNPDGPSGVNPGPGGGNGTPGTPPGTNPDGTPVQPGEPGTVNPGGVAPGGVGPSGTGTSTSPAPAVPPPIPPNGELSNCSTPGPRQIRRLTPVQYQRTVQAIFNDPGVPSDTVLSLASVLGFHVDADASLIRDLDGELLMNYAESVADWAIEQGKLNQFTSCTDQQPHCQSEFIRNLGERAHREPLDEASINSYAALFASESSFQDGARSVIAAMLQSPYTLYRRELGVQQGSEYVLTPYEVASQLAYFLTDAPPDAQLYEAAKNNQLSTPEQLLPHTERLLNSQYAEEALKNFVQGWLHIDKLPSKAKTESILPLPIELRRSMIEETNQLFVQLFKQGGTLADLYRADHTYVDGRLAAHYGFNGVGGDQFTRVDLNGTDRPVGMLGHAAFLTTHALSDNSSPVQRAKIVIERLICNHLPQVPVNLDVSLDTTTPFKTNRERYEVHRSVEPCKTCHVNLDPIGYTMENYDGFGLYRTEESGEPIDPSGHIAQLSQGRVELTGINDLSNTLAESIEAQACLVRFWSYYAYGTDSWTNYECNRDNIIRYAQDQDFSLRSVLNGIIQGPNFTRRVAD